MWTNQTRLWRFTLCVLLAIGTLAYTVAGEEVPSESQCRPYIEKALKGLEAGESQSGSVENNDSQEAGVENDTNEDTSAEEKGDDEGDSSEDGPSIEVADEPYVGQESADSLGAAEADDSKEDDSKEDDKEADQDDDSQATDDGDSKEVSADDDTAEQESTEDQGEGKEDDSGEIDDDGSQEGEGADENDKDDDGSDEKGDNDESAEDGDGTTAADVESAEDDDDKSEEVGEADDGDDSDEKDDDDKNSREGAEADATDEDDGDSKDDSKEDGNDDEASAEDGDDDKSGEDADDGESEEDATSTRKEDDDGKSGETDEKSPEDDKSSEDDDSAEKTTGESGEDIDGKSDEDNAEKSGENAEDSEEKANEDDDDSNEDSEEGLPEEELLKIEEVPDNLRSRDHIIKILRLDEEASEAEITIERSADIVLRDLKRLYENAIKPLETLYRYRDLSNRHFGDPEIFSKPLVLFMGPWSGGKSSLVNYLTGIEFTEWSLRTGAEPSPAYFNILMHGKEPEVLDGTQLAADWTFSGLQKFGQGLEERLRGLRYPSKLLEKVNIVEIPGILEVRKQVSRVFPFNDACQWFIDRADIIFLVYDPSKLDVGPETEAILDQLKGRESQTRILLNKADTVKPEELMRVQSALIWNISPLMSSAQPPVMYTVSLWSMPYEQSAPVRLLQAQERELLKDLRFAVDRRIDNKIASARRFAVRVRNHAKMVDCYLTTYYNHKTIFGNKKLIADAIIENPQNYHIYEGLSTLTNISRYDLPDPETYRDFFRLNPVYEFQQLSATCTYFRGCPINRLDVAIAYDFPELVGKYKKMVETSTPQGMPKS